MKLSSEIKGNHYSLSGDELISFIQNSLKDKTLKDIEGCYKTLFSDALQIDVNADIQLIAIKLDLADHLIKDLIKMKKSQAKDQVERMNVELEELILRMSIFKKDQNYMLYQVMLNSSEDMQKIRAEVQNIRNIHQTGWPTLNKLKALSTPGNISKEQWNDICVELSKFQSNLNDLLIRSTQEEKNYIQALQTMLFNMKTFIDFTLNAPVFGQLAPLATNIKTNLEEQTANLDKLFANTEVSYNKTQFDNFLSVLRLKRKGDLFIVAQEMKSFLLQNMLKAATQS